MNFVIRPASERDIIYILDGNKVIENKSYENVPKPLTAQRIRQEVFSDKPKGYIAIAEVDGQHAGFIIYGFCFFASEGEGIWVTNLYIDPFCRKSGIGKKFIDYLKEKYPEASGIYGSIAKTNTIARHFFSSLGAERYDDYIIYGFPGNGA